MNKSDSHGAHSKQRYGIEKNPSSRELCREEETKLQPVFLAGLVGVVVPDEKILVAYKTSPMWSTESVMIILNQESLLGISLVGRGFSEVPADSAHSGGSQRLQETVACSAQCSSQPAQFFPVRRTQWLRLHFGLKIRNCAI